ncbi:MAG: FGGY-family carbohydrate kinase [Calditrichia bacterium]|nr:FGGY-family carbohydrate kinase [Calditrichia bacterium]
MPAENILAIDNGTQSIRAILFDPKGNLIAKERIPIEPYFSTAPGLAEQKPQVFWDSLCRACKGLLAQPGVKKESIAAVSVTTQRSTVINLDKNSEPLRPAIIWLDQRRTENLPPLTGIWGLIFNVTGMKNTIAYLRAEAEVNWIRTHQPEIWEKTDKYLFLSGYLVHKLTGNFLDSIGSQVGYVPFDYKHQKWAANWDWKWQAIPMEKSLLPDLVPPGQSLGKITSAASEATGLPEGLSLIASGADKACEVIGAGCLEPHIGCLSYGTTATINTVNKNYKEVIPLIPPFPAAIPNAYNLEIQIYRGYWMVNWFKEEFGYKEQRLAEELDKNAEELFDDLVHSVPVGSEGLILQPYWSPGLKHPGPEAKGSIIGFGAHHTRAHIYRAILEGLTYALKDGAERISKRSGIPVTELRVAGGGSQSDAALQITADIFGLPATRPHTYETSGLGAAISAAVGAKIHPDYQTAISEMTHMGDTFEPSLKNHEMYTQLHRDVYKKMYPRLKPLYRAIRKITHNEF